VDPDRAAYFAADDVIDHTHPRVATQAARLRAAHPLETARRCFVYVRDAIAHSGDARHSPTTCTASEVLARGTGYCYAKSHLLVALLRQNGLAAGLCYQRLTVDGPHPPYCLHGLVAVELPELGFYAIDARGNKPGVDARFEPPHERLALPITHPGERDFPQIFARPLDLVVDCLRRHATWDAVRANLPDVEQL
jgi:transglutaminase-like putative cysteine protease